MKEGSRRICFLGSYAFLQMLPATVIGPAIRPLFARFHGGAEGPMHAFMSVNMLAAVIAAPLVGRFLDQRDDRRRYLRVLLLLDALLLALCAEPLSTNLVLTARFFEGAAHVGATTLILTEAASYARERGEPRIMGFVGAGIIFAVALGHVIGAWLVGMSPTIPFWAAAGMAFVLSVFAPRVLESSTPPRVEHDGVIAMLPIFKAMPVPVIGAFVARFTVGCLVVTFALFAHKGHQLSDRTIGGLFACMTLPFALATFPASQLAKKTSNAFVLSLGAGIYCAGLFALGWVGTSALPFLMGLLGCASAGIFSSTLGYASTLSREEETGRAMSLFNAAGCAGMLMGPMFAGILCAVAKSSQDPLQGYRLVFLCAAGSVGLFLLGSARWLVRELRKERAQDNPALAMEQSA